MPCCFFWIEGVPDRLVGIQFAFQVVDPPVGLGPVGELFEGGHGQVGLFVVRIGKRSAVRVPALEGGGVLAIFNVFRHIEFHSLL